ncbi:accessory Sec system S-layer assembly protein [Paenisporosarcina quisquiliarum]|uniref:Accessory Sec system S-layer assembly protein n=1 Tax=Paenisporosarcina quisquiliarum TaxID=365346 RepID=A0A9X3RDR4_9BACL|nr:accessory Sec system S-layer assembly protein [Paenisporosarcina quisquiliarum]MCZ8536628.1 accessory Sec system S-layer assembly protein [Paenisporosarcina quisquiliarum]
MGIFSIFKKTDKTGADSTVESNALLNVDETSDQSEEVSTALSLHPAWDVPKEQQYVFSFLSNELEPLKPNQISLSGIDIERDDHTQAWLVKAFLRTSLATPITLNTAELVLIDQNEKVVAVKEFNLAELGELPATSARPWVFVFEQPTLKGDLPEEGWRLAFNVQSLVPHKIELDPAWEEALSNEQKDGLKKIVESLPKLHDREVNFSGFQAKVQPDGTLAVSLFIRNGHSQQITLEQLPLEVLDANGKIVAQGAFTIDQLKVNANTSKPWTFLFPKEMVINKDPDMSKWTVRVPQSA